MNIIFKRSFLLSLGYLFLVTCSGGNDSPTEPEPTPPAANFTFNPSSGYAPLTVQFTSTSTGDITTFAWDFQNNLTTESTQRNPEYTYTEPGVYSVRLAVQGPGGNDTKIQENSITVLEVNAPVIEDIAQQTNEDVPLQITLSGTDPQDLELTYILTEGPQNGTVDLNGSTLIYTPDENWNGTETMKYIANNQYLDSNEATITITVNAVDDEPNTLDVSVETDEDTAISFVLNADEVDGDSYTFGILSNPSNGTIALNGNNVLYTPDADWNGVDTFTFEATDDRMAFDNKIIVNVGTATITVNAVNDAPVADNISVSLVENTALLISFSASDVESDNLSYSITSQPSNGGLGAVSGSQVLYTPNSDFNGTDSFTYQANDGTDNSNVATVNITITPANTAPVATNQSLTTDEDTSATLNLDATDINGDNLTYVIVENPSNATVSIDGSSATYTPNSDWNGTESFTWKANDGLLDSNTATVSVTVNAVNDAPAANNISTSYDTRTDASVNITLSASDPEDDTLTYAIVSDVSNGSTSISGSIVTYTASTDFEGTDTFTYKVNDGEYDSNTATVTITVDAEDVPTTTDVSAATDEDTAVDITLDGADEDGDTLTYSIVSDVSNGSTSLSGSTVTYTPDTNWNGTDTFTYKANDGTSDSNTSTVTITVSAVNDVPVTSSGTLTTSEDTAAQITLDIEDIDSSTVTASVVSQPSNGTVSIASGTFVATYTPNLNFNGTDSFSFIATDGISFSNESTVSITVTAVNDAPVANDVSGSTNENRSMQLNITLDATDIDGDALTYSIVSDVSNGTTSISGSTLTYTPDSNWNGTDTFTYKANDGSLDSNVATGTITVSEVNDAPTTENVSASTNEDTNVDITLDGSDVEGSSLTYSIVSDVSNGTTSLSGSTVTFSPDSNWNGTDTFTYKANDGTDDSNTSTVTITVTAVNDAPTTSNITLSGNEDTVLEGSLVGSDIDGDDLTFTIVSQPTNGSVTITSDGVTVQFDPDNNWNGTDTFTYKASDGSEDSNISTASVTVIAVNDAPTINETSPVTLNEDSNVDATLSGTDIDGDTITFSVVTEPSNGSVALSGTNNEVATYTPTANYNGSDSFIYKANDGTDDSESATIFFTVNAVNDAPVANDITVSTSENRMMQLSITLEGTDVDGDNLTYQIVESVSNGTLTDPSAGDTVTYTPGTNFNGTDTFTYKANDGTTDSNTATVTITVTAVNDAPIALDITTSTDEDTSVDVTLDGSDVDGDDLTYSIVSDVSNGTTSISGSTLTYTPSTNFNGTDTFTYKASDGTDDSNTATVTITVTAVNDAPVTSDQTASTDEDTAVDITLSSTDVEGDSVTYSIVSDVSNGSTSLSGSTVTYTPSANYNGTDTFTYKANDGTADSNTSTVTITVNAVNDVTTLTDKTITITEDVTSGNVENIILGSTTDIDGDTLTYSIVSNPSNGSLSNFINSAGLKFIIYTPNANFNGTDTFTFKANDGTADTNTATATVTVTAVNDAPVTSDQTASTDEDTEVDITLSSTDVEGDSVTYSIVSDVSNGSTSLSGSTVTYTPTADYNGTDTFTFKANDGTDDSNTSTVTITVAAVNDAPVAEDVTGSTNENRLSQLGITLVATDVDGDDLTYSIVATNDGTVTVSGSTATYTPNSNWNGTDTFTYKANDGTVDSNTATATITVASVEDTPVTADVTASTDEDTAVDITLDGSDGDGDSLTYSVVATNNGSVTISGSTATYTPDSNYNGTDTFTYKANDGDEDSNTSTVTVTVNSVNDAPNVGTTTINATEDTAKTFTTDDNDVDGDNLTYSIVSNPSNGSVSISGSTFTYTPALNFNGSDSFTYSVNDGIVDSETGTVNINVNSVNDAPTTEDGTASTNEDTAKAITLSATDVESNDLTFSIVSDVSNGTTSLSGSTVTYTPDANYNGTDTFTYKASDFADDSNISTITITVASVEDTPVTADVTASTDEDTAVDITLDGSDGDSGDTLTYSIVSDVSNGSTSLSGSTVTYTPTANYNGTDTFTYKVNDGDEDSNTSTVTITIAAVNDTPTTEDVSYSPGGASYSSSMIIDEDTVMTYDLTNSSNDVDGDDLTFFVPEDPPGTDPIFTDQPGDGVVTISGSILTYTPNTDFNGIDAFSYKANDGTVDSEKSTIQVKINAVNDLPTTSSQTASTDEDTAVDITLTSSDADTGDTITYSIVSDVSNGTTSLTDSTITYTPDANYNGADVLTFKANDGTGDSNTSTVTITITAVNDAPTTNDITSSINEDNAVDISVTASDVEGDDVTFSIVSDVSNGTTSVSDSTITYTPDDDFNGTDTFTYKANDGTDDSNTSTVTITVNPVNDAPIAQDVTGSTNENRMMQLGVTLVATDVDGDDLTYSIVATNDGTVTVSGSTATYTPNSNWNGTDTFTYKANDGTVDSNTATATITVASVEDTPVTADVTASTDEDTAVDITLDGSDGDGDSLTYSVVATNNGSVTISGSTATYTPDSNYNGTDTFTYKANDGDEDSNTSTVTVTVAAVNDLPTTSNQSESATEDLTKTITLTSSDPDTGDTITYSIVSDVSNGSTSLSGSTVTYNSTSNYNGTDSFTYKANDGTGDSNTSTVTITIAAVNDAPVTSGVNDGESTISATEDINKDIDLSTYTTDVDSNNLTYTIVTQPNDGTITVSGSTATYVPDSNFNGGQSFEFKANDGSNDSNTSQLNISVASVNDSPNVTDLTITLDEDTTANFSVNTATDVDDNNGFTYDVRGSNIGGGGSFQISGSTGTYTPRANFNGTESATYGACDGIIVNGSNSCEGTDGTITFIVNPVEDSPTTNDVSASVNEDSTVDITLQGADEDVAYQGDTLTYSIVSDVSNGSTSLSGSTVTYTPTANYNGTDTFTYKVNDGDEDSNTSTVTITVNSIEDSPLTSNVTATTDEDVAVAVSLSGSDGDSGDTLTYSIVSDVSNGSTSLSGSTVTYTPTANYNGTDSFTYKVNDGDEDSNTSTAVITIASVEDIPATQDVSASTDEDNAVDITLNGSDGDSGDTLTYSIVSDVSNGSTSLSGSTVTYTPTANYNGTDTFTYKLNDGDQDSNTSTVTVTVASINDLPTTQDIATTINENRYASRMTGITLQGTDVDGDDLTYSVVSDASNGSTSISGSTLTYTADQDYNGTETITYKANDGTGDSNTSTITITITPVNDTPVVSGTDDTYWNFDNNSGANEQVTVSSIHDVLGSSPVTFSADFTINQIANGAAFHMFEQGNGGGLFDIRVGYYDVCGNLNGNYNTTTDNPKLYITLGIRNNNSNNECRIGSVAQSGNFGTHYYNNAEVDNDGFKHNLTATINPSTQETKIYWDYVLVGTQTYSGTTTGSGGFASRLVWANNDVDVDIYKMTMWSGTELSESQIVTNGSNMDQVVSPTNQWNFSDSSGSSTVTDSVGSLDGSVVNGDSGGTYTYNQVTMNKNNTATIDLSSYVTDVDGDNLTYSIVSDVTYGSTSLSGSTVTYTPTSNRSGADKFTWKANDGVVDSATGNVDITITNNNNAPTVSNATASTDEDNAVDITLSSTDLDSDSVTYSIVSDVSNGSTSLSGSTVTYTPSANYNGTDSFTYKANDGTDDSSTATVTITVAAVNDIPTTSNQTASTSQDVAVNITLSSTDNDGDTITYSIVSDVSNGSTSLSGSTVTYTPTSGWSGTDTFTFKANDGTADSNTSTVTITVAPPKYALDLSATDAGGFTVPSWENYNTTSDSKRSAGTFAAWIYIEETPSGNMNIISRDDTAPEVNHSSRVGTRTHFQFQVTSGLALYFRSQYYSSHGDSGFTGQTNDNVITLNTWHHVAFSVQNNGCNGGTIYGNKKFYVDGVEVAGTSGYTQTNGTFSRFSGNCGQYGDGPNALVPYNTQISVGKNYRANASNYGQFKGYIDEVVYYDSFMGQSDISTMYNNGEWFDQSTLTGYTDNLMGWWNFDSQNLDETGGDTSGGTYQDGSATFSVSSID